MRRIIRGASCFVLSLFVEPLLLLLQIIINARFLSARAAVTFSASCRYQSSVWFPLCEWDNLSVK